LIEYFPLIGLAFQIEAQSLSIIGERNFISIVKAGLQGAIFIYLSLRLSQLSYCFIISTVGSIFKKINSFS
jgi:hypothetical protein